MNRIILAGLVGLALPEQHSLARPATDEERKAVHRRAARDWFNRAMDADRVHAPRSTSELLDVAAAHERAAYEGCDPARCFFLHHGG